MEKHTAHYRIDEIKAVVMARGIAAFTRVAREGSQVLGMSQAQALAVVLSLEKPCPNGRTAYIKVTLRTDGAVVIQFKEL
jgi:motility quorum-sensing regulator/GCU-specific mRNA interferase toxin